MIALDPNESAGADAALTKLGYLHALFITEIKAHAEDLERRWDTLEDAWQHERRTMSKKTTRITTAA